MPRNWLTNWLSAAEASAAAKPEILESAAFTAGVELTAAAGEGRRPAFSIEAYSGAVIQVEQSFYPCIVELSGVRVDPNTAVLLNHDPEQLVGQGQASVSASGIKIVGTVTGDDAAAQKVVTHSKNGFKWQASIGASAIRREFLEAGKGAVVNGREVTGPMMIWRESILGEVSFVPRGADSQTSAAIAAAQMGGQPMVFEAWLTAKGFDPATITAAQRTSMQTIFDAEVKAGGAPTGGAAGAGHAGTPPVTVPATAVPAVPAAPITAAATTGLPAQPDIIAQMRAESFRSSEIRRLCAGKHNDIEAQAIRDGWGVDQVELHVLRANRPNAPGIIVIDNTITDDVLQAAACMVGSLADTEKSFQPQVLEAAHRRFRHGLGLQELFMEAAWRNGYQGRRFKGDEEAVLRAAFSTASLSGILSNIANKFLLDGYSHVEETWRAIASIGSVSDFKTMTSYRMTGGFQFLEVGPSGELKHDTVDELSYTNQAKTYGRMFAITRTQTINDDMGALTSTPRKIGRGGALKLNDVFWTAFLANSDFFKTGNANYFEGAATNLQSSSLKTAVETFRKQTDADGKPLGTTPKTLLLPPELEVIGDELYVSTNNNTGGSATTEKVPNRNTFAGKYKPEVSAYLSNSSYSGYSTTGWYLLADPLDISVIEVVFLNGRQQPTVESAEADFNTLGVQMRGYFDFGVTKQDFRGGVKSKGAAA